MNEPTEQDLIRMGIPMDLANDVAHMLRLPHWEVARWVSEPALAGARMANEVRMRGISG